VVEGMKNIETPEKHDMEMNIEEPNLKSIRESKGLTLKEIFQHTRISVANLEAIENSQYHLLPPPVFTKSFMRTYAKFLNIDDKILLSRYDRYLETLQEKHYDADIKKTPKFSGIHYKIFAWIFFLLVIISLVTFSLSSYQASVDTVKNQIVQSPPPTADVKPSPAPDAKTEITTGASTTPPAAPLSKETKLPVSMKKVQTASKRDHTADVTQSTAKQEEVTQQETHADSYDVIMEARELTWLRITADHNPPQEILLKPGEKIKKSGSTFTIDVGNAGGIDIQLDGKSLGILGRHGQVVHLKLP
jgi:cytoskeletal protein RodZ